LALPKQIRHSAVAAVALLPRPAERRAQKENRPPIAPSLSSSQFRGASEASDEKLEKASGATIS